MHVDAGSKAARFVAKPSRRRSLASQRVLETTDSVLDLAFDLIGLAVSRQFGIAYRLADVSLTEPLNSFTAPAIRSLFMIMFSFCG